MISSVVSLACLKIPNGEIVILHRDRFPVALPARRRNVYSAIRGRRITSHVIKVKQKRRDIDDTQSGEVAYEISRYLAGLGDIKAFVHSTTIF